MQANDRFVYRKNASMTLVKCLQNFFLQRYLLRIPCVRSPNALQQHRLRIFIQLRRIENMLYVKTAHNTHMSSPDHVCCPTCGRELCSWIYSTVTSAHIRDVQQHTSENVVIITFNAWLLYSFNAVFTFINSVKCTTCNYLTLVLEDKFLS
uniref:Uncharacterized protein n=1 Tax=Arion vulgaris TaxID=1028688 RepID=A0A0B7BT81_9EUPU